MKGLIFLIITTVFPTEPAIALIFTKTGFLLRPTRSAAFRRSKIALLIKFLIVLGMFKLRTAVNTIFVFAWHRFVLLRGYKFNLTFVE